MAKRYIQAGCKQAKYGILHRCDYLCGIFYIQKQQSETHGFSLGEAKEFSKEVRQYLYEIEKQRPLTDMEKELWDKTHRIHVRTEDSRMMIQEQYEEIYPAVAL